MKVDILHTERMCPPESLESPAQVTIREVSSLPNDSFEVEVLGASGKQGSTLVTVRSPFTSEEEENDIKWYCEAADREPFSVSPRLQRVERSLREYGTRLFNMVFSQSGTAIPEERSVVVRVSGSSQFCSLHWELLVDPSRGPLALDSSRYVVRTLLGEADMEPRVPHSIISYPTLNVLFLTARQRVDGKDIPLRVESLAVMNVVRDKNLPLRFDLVRPGTITALKEKLSQHRPGFYHILHLDCHGADSDHEFPDPYCTQSNRLLLEAERASHSTVSADEIAEIVDTYKIPIVFTTACRSGKTNPGVPSFAYELFSRSSVQCVLAMALSVLVDTTARFVREFYAAMLDTDASTSARKATRRARLAMWSDPNRKGVLAVIPRQDWWIPQLFERGLPDEGRTGLFQRCTWEEAAVQSGTPGAVWEESQLYIKRTNLLVYESVDQNKFIGRDEDLRMLECKVFSHDRGDNVILLYGMMGSGKTAFMTYISWWWCVTGLVRDKFVFRLHERPFTLNDMIWHIYRQIFNVVNYDPNALVRQTEEDRRRVTEYLRKNCYVIVIDSAERLCSRDNSCDVKGEVVRDDTAPAQEDSESESDLEDARNEFRSNPRMRRREDIARWLADLQGGRTIVLVGSRGSSESYLMKYIRNKSNKLDLATVIGGYPKRLIGNLSQEWSKVLVNQILSANGDSEHPKYECLKSFPMLDLYAGNPLVINLVVGGFKGGDMENVPSSEELYDRLHKYVADPIASTSVMKSLEFSFNLMSTSQQEALLFLAPFKSSVTSQALSHYADALERNKPDCPKFNRTAWDSAIQTAVRWGLLTVHERVKRQRSQQAWRIHACLSILLMKKLCHKLASSSRGTIKELSSSRGLGVLENVDKEAFLCPMLSSMHVAYWKWALHLYDCLRDSDKAVHDSGRVMTEIDFWNLKRVLKYALDTKQAFYGILLPLYWYLASKNDIAQRFALCRRIVERIGVCGKLSDIASTNIVYRLDIPRTYHIYGMLLGHNRLNKLDEAEVWLNHAKRIWDECGNENELAVTEHELGWVAMNKRDYVKAKSHYNNALKLSNRIERSRTLHNMGLLAAFEKDFRAARKYHEEARILYEKEGDEQAIASAYHHLAIVSARVHMYEEAEEYAKKALATRKEREETEQTANVYQLRGNIALRRAIAARDSKTALQFIDVAKRKYDKAMLAYNYDSGFHYGVIPEREMLHENYGLLMAMQRRLVGDAEEKQGLLGTEMDSYMKVKDGPYPKALYNLGLNYEEYGKFDRAFDCFQQASQIAPISTQDSVNREACASASIAKARCLASGKGVAKDEHEALTIMLKLRGEITSSDPLDSLGLPYYEG